MTKLTADSEFTCPSAVPRLGTQIDAFQTRVLSHYHARDNDWSGCSAAIDAVAEQILRHIGFSRPPVSVERLTQILQVELLFQRWKAGLPEAEIRPVGKNLRITVYRSRELHKPLTNRERFSLVHECAHSFFFYRSGRAISRIIPSDFAGYHSKSSHAIREEGLCDRFARAVLIPSECRKAIKEKQPSAEALMCIADEYLVSGEVAVRRILHDFQLWADSVVYRVWFTQPMAQVKAFWGTRARGRSKFESGAALERRLAGVGRKKVTALLKASLHVGPPDITERGDQVWVRKDLQMSSSRHGELGEPGGGVKRSHTFPPSA